MKTALLRAILISFAFAAFAEAAPRIEDAFRRPPEEARPWVFWFWSDGNVTKEGITADLEAMKRVGIGGVIFMEVDQDVPKGPARFMTPEWRALFAFAVSEAGRLGLKIDLNNDAGWTGSGGPWIDAEHSMQKVVSTETKLTGPMTHDAVLPQPEATADFYRDIAVLAFPTPASDRRVERFIQKSGLGLAGSPDGKGNLPAEAVIPSSAVVDLTAQCERGRLTWEVPAGNWTVVRIGHTSTGKTNYPSVAEGKGLEVDKLSAAAFDRHYDGFTAKIMADAGPAGRAALPAVHIDSWEVGYQNWTSAFRDEFRRRRGYDLVTWLPALFGRVMESEERTERFLWDVRRTVSELVNDNYASRMAARAHADGRVFTLEAYNNGPFDCLSYGARCDVPVGEFWMTREPGNLHTSVKTMTSVGHIYGKTVIGAEAFTATDAAGRQRNHPYSMKAIGDAAFCAGINHFIIHRYSMQPWTDERKPGMTMGPWGVEYERTATWWEQTKPWHEYLARCQYLLQQGRFVADFCYLQSEEGYNNPAGPADQKPVLPEGYDFDWCSDEVVHTRMSVQDGRLVLADGMAYRVLVLPTQRLMTPALLRKIRNLVRDGATVFGRPPLRSPSLSGYPRCDEELLELVTELWGDNPDAAGAIDRRVGKGRIVWAPDLKGLLASLPLEPDFAFRRQASNDNEPRPAVRTLHRSLPDRDVYFVANLGALPVEGVASFRVSGTPELWDAESGAIQPAVAYVREGDRTRLPLQLGARGSVFVVLKHAADTGTRRLTAIARNGVAIAETGPVSLAPISRREADFKPVIGTFTIAAWVNPAADTALTKPAASGTSAYSVARNDVLFAPPVHEVLGKPDLAGAGFAVGRNGVTVHEHGDHHYPATLVHAVPISGWTHIAIVFEDGKPTLYVNGDRVAAGLKTTQTVYGGVGVPHGRDPQPFRGEHSALTQLPRALSADEIRSLMTSTPKVAVPPVKPAEPPARLPAPALRFADGRAFVSQPGQYELTFAHGARRTTDVASLPSQELNGPWSLRFPGGWGAPSEVELPQLLSWSEHPEPGVRYFSGTATYRTQVDVARDLIADGRRVWLDLGEVQVVAEVRLNGRALATLWRPPFRVDVTDVVHAGRNELEIAVTNLWVNRLIGDEQLPLDREWTKVPRRGGFALKAYPEWLVRGERSPTGRVTFTTWKHYEKDAPLLRSGLIGPVRLTTESELPLQP